MIEIVQATGQKQIQQGSFSTEIILCRAPTNKYSVKSHLYPQPPKHPSLAIISCQSLQNVPHQKVQIFSFFTTGEYIDWPYLFWKVEVAHRLVISFLYGVINTVTNCATF